jgi:hypothetical protein
MRGKGCSSEIEDSLKNYSLFRVFLLYNRNISSAKSYIPRWEDSGEWPKARCLAINSAANGLSFSLVIGGSGPSMKLLLQSEIDDDHWGLKSCPWEKF